MTQKRKRISMGVMAVCCGVLSLSVVARESASHNEIRSDVAAEVSSRKYPVIQHHHTVHPGGSFSNALETIPIHVTTPLASTLKAIQSPRQRKTRETISFTLPVSNSAASSSSTRDGQIRRRRMEPKMQNIPSPLIFMPSRGRRFGGFDAPTEKRQITIEQMLEKGDYFVPNRGKKTSTTNELTKKGKFDVLLGGSTDEYFFPNRGKKQYLPTYDSTSNVKPFPGRDTRTFERKLDDFAIPIVQQQLQQPMEIRLRRNLLENLANEHKDTFFSSRGKRILPFVEELMLKPLPEVKQEIKKKPQEMFPDERSAELSSQSNDLDALLWSEEFLLPLGRPTI